MKKLLSFALMLMACIAANAQDGVSDESYEAMAKNTTVALPIISTENYQNAYAATAPQSALAENYKNDPAYRKARGWRTAGIVMTCVGTATCAAFAIGAHDTYKDDNIAGALFAGPMMVGYSVIGGITAISGAVIWGISNAKMKRIKASSSGLGLALEF